MYDPYGNIIDNTVNTFISIDESNNDAIDASIPADESMPAEASMPSEASMPADCSSNTLQIE